MLASSKSVFCSVVVALLATASVAHAETMDTGKVVEDRGDHVVRSIAFGTCVRTKWEVGTDVCAPVKEVVAEAPKPAPQPVVRTVLGTEEKTVYFPFDSAVLSDEAKQRLDGVADKLGKAQDVKSAQIVGYADHIGASDYNEHLSKRRAESVQKYLGERGYLRTQVAEVRAMGEAQPVSTCDSSLARSQAIECLSPDRRVEVEIQYTETQNLSQTQSY